MNNRTQTGSMLEPESNINPYPKGQTDMQPHELFSRIKTLREDHPQSSMRELEVRYNATFGNLDRDAAKAFTAMSEQRQRNIGNAVSLKLQMLAHAGHPGADHKF